MTMTSMMATESIRDLKSDITQLSGQYGWEMINRSMCVHRSVIWSHEMPGMTVHFIKSGVGSCFVCRIVIGLIQIVKWSALLLLLLFFLPQFFFLHFWNPKTAKIPNLTQPWSDLSIAGDHDPDPTRPYCRMDIRTGRLRSVLFCLLLPSDLVPYPRYHYFVQKPSQTALS